MAANQNIVDRVVERIKTQPLGDLITDEDLYDIVKEAIPKAFFTPQTVVTGSGYHEKTTVTEPVIVTVLREHLRASVEKQVAEWTVTNANVIADYWRGVMDKGLLEYVQKIADQKATAQVMAALRPMVETINQDRAARGLPPIFI
jgi:hypothetical protein